MSDCPCRARRTTDDHNARPIVRITAAAFAFGLIVAVWSGYVVLPAAFCDVEPTAPERINPNTAAVPALMRLPGIGRVRAMDIEAARAERPFDSAVDLERIRGIGPKTVEKIEPYLTFEEQKSIKEIE